MNATTQDHKGKPLVSLLSREQLELARLSAEGMEPEEISEVTGMALDEVKSLLLAAAAILQRETGSFAEVFKLTGAQLDVCEAAANGASNDEIAAKLMISKGTVKVHLRTAFRKLGITKRTELVNIFEPEYVIDTQFIALKGFELAIINRITQGRTDPEIAEEFQTGLGRVQTAIRELIKFVNDAFMAENPELFTQRRLKESTQKYLISNRTQLAAWWLANVEKLRAMQSQQG